VKKKRRQPSLPDTFRKLDEQTKDLLAKIEQPRQLGFAALTLAAEHARQERLSPGRIIEALEAAGVSLKRTPLVRAMASAGNRVSTRVIDGEPHYTIMTKGRREVEPFLKAEGLNLLYVDGSTPRTDRRKLEEILGGLSGLIRICDPYYGVQTLDALELIPVKCTVRFLTATMTGNTKSLSRVTRDFRRERPNTELRCCSNARAIHDRYIVSDDKLLLIGHGLKDIGNRESFVVIIQRSLISDLIKTLEKNFDGKWKQAASL